MSISDYDVIDSHVERFRNNLKTQTVGKVTEINYVGDYIESVTVKPYVNTQYKDGLSMEKASCYRVPLIYPSGNGGILSFPIKIGDPVFLMFCHEDIENYMETGDKGNPNTLRRFTSNDVVAIPCLHPHSESLKPSKDKFQIKYKEADITIDEEGTVFINTPSDVVVESASNVSIKATNVSIDSGEVTMTGNLRVDGNVTSGGDVETDSGISLNTHIHPLTKGVTLVPK